MTVYHLAHVKALKDLIEIMNLAAVLALFGDCLWVAHDIYEKGFSLYMGLIALSLTAGLSLAVFGGIKYHTSLVESIIKMMSHEKKMAVKAKARINRKRSCK